MLIKNINTFFKTSKTNSCHLCLRCLNSFSSKEFLSKHKLKCEKHDYCNISIPENAIIMLEYTKHNYRNRIPFVIYADFELINDSTLFTFQDEVNPERPAIKTRRIKHQSVAAIGALIKSDHEEIIPVVCNISLTGAKMLLMFSVTFSYGLKTSSRKFLK
jgi:hypothetical protein